MRTRRLRLFLVCAAVTGALAACGGGTPAAVKPASNPLPGLTHDVHAAQQAVNEEQAPPAGSTGATMTY
jgi:hypothetical protein